MMKSVVVFEELQMFLYKTLNKDVHNICIDNTTNFMNRF